MALSDDHPIKIVYEDYLPAHKSEMSEYLFKLATDPETNEDSEPADTTMYPDPGEGKDLHEEEPRKMVDGKDEPFHNNDEVFEESVDVRRGVLKREFETMEEAQKNDMALMAANFEHVSSGNFSSHSALLQPKTKTGSARELTLSERMRKIT